MFAWKNHGRSAGPHRWLVERFAPRVVIQREIPGSWSSTFSGQHAVSQTSGGTVMPLTRPSPLSMAIAGGESSHAALVRKHAAADGGFAAASRAGSAARRNQSGRPRGVEGGVSEKSLRNGANHGLLVLAKALSGASGSLALERMQKKIAAAATGGILSSPGKQNGDSGLGHYLSSCIGRGSNPREAG